MQKNNKVNIILIGPSLCYKGGISTVERLILKSNMSEIFTFHHISSSSQGIALNKIYCFLKAIYSLYQHLTINSRSIVHINIASNASAIRKVILLNIANYFKVPTIIHFHGGAFDKFYTSLPSIVQRLLTHELNKASKYICLANYWKKFYTEQMNIPSEKIKVLYNPIKLPDKIPDRKDKQKLQIVYLGIMDNRKGAFRLINAYSTLPKQIKNKLSMTLAGNGNVEHARSLVKKYNIEKDVAVLDWITGEHKDEILKSSDIFVLPSTNEGLPMSMLESMSYGLPVIVSPVGGIPEVIKDHVNGVLIDPNNIEGIKAAIQELTENESLRLKLGEHARKTAEGMNIKSYMKNLESIYNSIQNN